MAGYALNRQTDRLTDKEQTCRQEDAATVDLGLIFLPIRSYKKNDIIPVLIGQQEGRQLQNEQQGVWVGAQRHYEKVDIIMNKL